MGDVSVMSSLLYLPEPVESLRSIDFALSIEEKHTAKVLPAVTHGRELFTIKESKNTRQSYMTLVSLPTAFNGAVTMAQL
jgi:hypothetical protein